MGCQHSQTQSTLLNIQNNERMKQIFMKQIGQNQEQQFNELFQKQLIQEYQQSFMNIQNFIEESQIISANQSQNINQSKIIGNEFQELPESFNEMFQKYLGQEFKQSYNKLQSILKNPNNYIDIEKNLDDLNNLEKPIKISKQVSILCQTKASDNQESDQTKKKSILKLRVSQDDLFLEMRKKNQQFENFLDITQSPPKTNVIRFQATNSKISQYEFNSKIQKNLNSFINDQHAISLDKNTESQPFDVSDQVKQIINHEFKKFLDNLETSKIANISKFNQFQEQKSNSVIQYHQDKSILSHNYDKESLNSSQFDYQVKNEQSNSLSNTAFDRLMSINNSKLSADMAASKSTQNNIQNIQLIDSSNLEESRQEVVQIVQNNRQTNKICYKNSNIQNPHQFSQKNSIEENEVFQSKTQNKQNLIVIRKSQGDHDALLECDQSSIIPQDAKFKKNQQTSIQYFLDTSNQNELIDQFLFKLSYNQLEQMKFLQRYGTLQFKLSNDLSELCASQVLNNDQQVTQQYVLKLSPENQQDLKAKGSSQKQQQPTKKQQEFFSFGKNISQDLTYFNKSGNDLRVNDFEVSVDIDSVYELDSNHDSTVKQSLKQQVPSNINQDLSLISFENDGSQCEFEFISPEIKMSRKVSPNQQEQQCIKLLPIEQLQNDNTQSAFQNIDKYVINKSDFTDQVTIYQSPVRQRELKNLDLSQITGQVIQQNVNIVTNSDSETISNNKFNQSFESNSQILIQNQQKYQDEYFKDEQDQVCQEQSDEEFVKNEEINQNSQIQISQQKNLSINDRYKFFDDTDDECTFELPLQINDKQSNQISYNDYNKDNDQISTTQIQFADQIHQSHEYIKKDNVLIEIQSDQETEEIEQVKLVPENFEQIFDNLSNHINAKLGTNGTFFELSQQQHQNNNSTQDAQSLQNNNIDQNAKCVQNSTSDENVQIVQNNNNSISKPKFNEYLQQVKGQGNNKENLIKSSIKQQQRTPQSNYLITQSRKSQSQKMNDSLIVKNQTLICSKTNNKDKIQDNNKIVNENLQEQNKVIISINNPKYCQNKIQNYEQFKKQCVPVQLSDSKLSDSKPKNYIGYRIGSVKKLNKITFDQYLNKDKSTAFTQMDIFNQNQQKVNFFQVMNFKVNFCSFGQNLNKKF